MKEVKEWNGKPRWMWVWDAVEECKKKDYVICILTEILQGIRSRI